MTKAECVGTSYMPIGGGYAYCALRVGIVVRAPNGKEIYCQPGDDESIMRENIAALDQVSLDVDCPKRGAIADMILGDYFS
jgi:hypothetical protein